MAKKLKYDNSEEVLVKYAVKDSHGTNININEINSRIDNVQSRGRYLSLWNASTGLPETNPTTALPYVYKRGDYYIVGTLGNKIPTGNQYDGTASTVTTTTTLQIGDNYLFDGTVWTLLANTSATVTWNQIAGTDPLVNTALAGVINSKLNKTGGTLDTTEEFNLEVSNDTEYTALNIADGSCIFDIAKGTAMGGVTLQYNNDEGEEHISASLGATIGTIPNMKASMIEVFPESINLGAVDMESSFSNTIEIDTQSIKPTGTDCSIGTTVNPFYNETLSGSLTFKNSTANQVITNDGGDLAFYRGNAAGMYRFRLTKDAAIFTKTVRPLYDNTTTLGTSNQMWSSVYAMSLRVGTDAIQSISNHLFIDAQNDIETNGGFYPTVTNMESLGKSENKWKDLYLSGNLCNGTTTVAIGNIVETIGAQSIDGEKTFTSNMSTRAVIPSGNGTYNCGTDVHRWFTVYTQNLNASSNIRIGADNIQYTSNHLFLDAQNGIETNGTFYPIMSNYIDLGKSTDKWKDLYLSGKITAGSLSDGTTTKTITEVLSGTDSSKLVVDDLPATGSDGQLVILRRWNETYISSFSELVVGQTYHWYNPEVIPDIVGKITYIMTDKPDITNINTAVVPTIGADQSPIFGFYTGHSNFVLMPWDSTISEAKTYDSFVGSFDFIFQEYKDDDDTGFAEMAMVNCITKRNSVAGYDLYVYKNNEWHRVDVDTPEEIAISVNTATAEQISTNYAIITLQINDDPFDFEGSVGKLVKAYNSSGETVIAASVTSTYNNYLVITDRSGQLTGSESWTITK